ncbi:MAG: nitroreductase family protein [Desulfovibrionaceae bacterium]|nr:nitroreductase family protein [Desulfovibrionaceae bacterium]
MDALEAIFTRRSIRKFLPKAISREEIEELLQAAMAAPSAGNGQPWLFLVITDKLKLAQIPSIHPYAAMCPEAAAAILVCGDPQVAKYADFWPQDCSAAVQNFLLAARARNLGTVWCGVYPTEERMQAFRKVFGLPDAVAPFALVALGHPDQPFDRRDRYDAAKVHWETW